MFHRSLVNSILLIATLTCFQPGKAVVPVTEHNLLEQLSTCTISHYTVCYGICNYSGKKILVIRELEASGRSYYIGVDPNSLETCLMQASAVQMEPCSWQKLQATYKNTPYISAIRTASGRSYSLQDAGIVHGFPKEKGITLTVDLCPSHKPLDRIIFTSLISEFWKTEKPVPIALSVTGRFMLSHEDDIRWLKGLIEAHEITVTWVNHTYNHRYSPWKPLKNNFLLSPGTDINLEILKTEKTMLEHGLLFSVFFRFPGLVSDHRVVDILLGYGLIPIGTDAWLAKGQQAYAGSIVLIHGNGNEPLGVKDFLTMLKGKREAVMKKEWLLYDLRQAVDLEFMNQTSKSSLFK
ncbi:MAG: polysaccharide deacetylase [Bacteroidota bacterium]|nr:polysaccharide deacetylase [Bacteroidota bacterium]